MLPCAWVTFWFPRLYRLVWGQSWVGFQVHNIFHAHKSHTGLGKEGQGVEVPRYSKTLHAPTQNELDTHHNIRNFDFSILLSA